MPFSVLVPVAMAVAAAAESVTFPSTLLVTASPLTGKPVVKPSSGRPWAVSASLTAVTWFGPMPSPMNRNTYRSASGAGVGVAVGTGLGEGVFFAAITTGAAVAPDSGAAGSVLRQPARASSPRRAQTADRNIR